MIVKALAVGGFLTNCYVACCEQTKEAIVVDPGFDEGLEAERLFKLISGSVLTVKLIVNTHGHPDHTCGNGIVKDRFPVPILIHEYDAHMLGKTGRRTATQFGFENTSPPADRLLRDGDLITFGKVTLKIIHTPGHSRGSISLLGEKEIFTGDTLFAGSIGRVDFPESSEADMSSSLKSLAHLPDQLVVYPGHGPTTMLGEEKRSNPFLQDF